MKLRSFNLILLMCIFANIAPSNNPIKNMIHLIIDNPISQYVLSSPRFSNPIDDESEYNKTVAQPWETFEVNYINSNIDETLEFKRDEIVIIPLYIIESDSIKYFFGKIRSKSGRNKYYIKIAGKRFLVATKLIGRIKDIRGLETEQFNLTTREFIRLKVPKEIRDLAYFPN